MTQRASQYEPQSELQGGSRPLNFTFQSPVPRYLVPFNPRRVLHRFTDVLVLGGGIAGLRAALEVPPHLSVLVVTKDAMGESNSRWAQGGIAGVLGPDDRFENHVDDTLRAGGSLCDRAVVEMVVREAPARIQELMDWGTQFDLEQGSLALGREGGHSHHRIVHALGDATGKEMMRAISARVCAMSNLQTLAGCFTLDLLVHEGRCRGALVWHERSGMVMIWSRETVLCTGGVGQLYRESTNPLVATGDGHAMAYRAGLPLRDMEFIQFHPTVLYIAGTGRSLITEAVRGEGAHLVDKNGYRFMNDYDSRGELAPRDVVSQAIVSQMDKTHHACVYLDLTHMDAARVRARFPGIAERCAQFDIDIHRDWVPIRPGAHYMIGGVTVDAVGKTEMDSLWGAGEVTSSGLHGANRLASNSLLEGLVFGAHAGRNAAQAASDRTAERLEALPIENPSLPPNHEPLDLADIRNSLKSVMWRHVGVRRNREGLEEAARDVDQWCRYVLPRQFDHPTGWELQSMLTVGRTIIEAALARPESRGVHLRTDHPAPAMGFANHHVTLRRHSG